jgi:hypothetical protein
MNKICYVFRFAWLIMGSGLDDLNLLAFLLQLRPIMAVHNQWPSKTRSIPCWTASVFSSATMNGEHRVTTHILNSLTESKSRIDPRLHKITPEYTWTLLRMNYHPYITPRRPEYRPPPLRTVSCHSPVVMEMCVLGNRCLTNGLSLLFVTISAFRLCLPNRCLAMVIFVKNKVQKV